VTTWTQIRKWQEAARRSNHNPPVGMLMCLTVCQPYAEEIARRSKMVENRTWATAYRGPLIIHAGKSRAWTEMDDEELAHTYGRKLEFGAIVAVANVIDCVRVEEIESKYPSLISDAHAHHVNGPWCFVLEGAQRIEPAIPYRGAQGFFHVPESVLAPTTEAGE